MAAADGRDEPGRAGIGVVADESHPVIYPSRFTLMRPLVLINDAAGTSQSNGAGNQAEQVRGAFAALGVSVDVLSVKGLELAGVARREAEGGRALIIAGGGDGTISSVAGAVAGTKVALGVLPLGTLNHFAKDLGLPLTLADAAAVIAAAVNAGLDDAHVRAVDVAEVNGRVFINNSSIGLYPHIVRKRDRQMHRLGRGKWLAMLIAGVSVFRRFPTVRVRLSLEGETYPRTTPFVFVGNNRYEFDLFNFGRRVVMDGCELGVYFANRTGRFGLLVLMVRALLGRLEQAKDFDSTCVRELWIDTPKKHLRVAVDGEVVELKPPLHYRSRPYDLRVVVGAGVG